MVSWDSWLLRPRLLGVEGVDGILGVGMFEMDEWAEWLVTRDSGRLYRDTAVPVSETGSRVGRARSCAGWNLGRREVAGGGFVVVWAEVVVFVKVSVVAGRFEGLVARCILCLTFRLSVDLPVLKTSPSPISIPAKKSSLAAARLAAWRSPE